MHAVTGLGHRYAPALGGTASARHDRQTERGRPPVNTLTVGAASALRVVAQAAA